MLPLRPGLRSRSDRDYAPAHPGIMLPLRPGLRSRTLRDYAPAPTDSLWSVTLSPCCASCRSMVKTDLNEKDQRHIPCERNLPLASMFQIYLLYLKGVLLYVRCSVFGVRCSVKDCTGRILCVKGFSEKMLTFFASGYIFFSHNLVVGSTGSPTAELIPGC